MITAEEYCKKRHNESPNNISWIDFNVMVMKEYAQIAIKADRKNLIKYVKICENGFALEGGYVSRQGIDEDSILNAPLIELS